MKTKEEILDVIERYLNSKNKDVRSDFEAMLGFLARCVEEGWDENELNGLMTEDGMRLDDAIASRYCLLLFAKKLSFKDYCPLIKEEYKQVLAYREYKTRGMEDTCSALFDKANIPTKVIMCYWAARKYDQKVEMLQKQKRQMTQFENAQSRDEFVF